jgi:hypothetical protein
MMLGGDGGPSSLGGGGRGGYYPAGPAPGIPAGAGRVGNMVVAVAAVVIIKAVILLPVQVVQA